MGFSSYRSGSINSVEHRHLNVHDNHVKMVASGMLDRRLAVKGQTDLPSARQQKAQQLRQHLGRVRLVVDNKQLFNRNYVRHVTFGRWQEPFLP